MPDTTFAAEFAGALNVLPRGIGSWQERMIAEGDPYAASFFSTSTTVPAGGQNLVIASVQLPRVAKVIYIEEISISVSTLGVYQLSTSSDVNGRFTQLVKQVIIAPNQNVVIPVRTLFRGFQTSNGVMSLAIRNNLSGAVADITGTIAVSGWALTDDFDYSAKNVILWAGDSTANGSSYTSTGKSRMAITREYWRAQGSSVRMLLKSRSGSTTSDHELWRREGWYDVPTASIGIYDLGLNDAATSVAAGDKVTAGTYIYNLNAFWQWWKARYPGKRLIVLGVAPLENNTSEGFAAQYRTAAANFVASEANPLLSYINTGAAFDRTQGTTFYSSSDTAGQRVHRNDNGEAAIATVITNGLTAQGIALP